ncbi:MAG: cupin domain-containing protein [Armatimonadota bacterium]|nr:cupin domain-containing protein [Armatimonadota bacterium]MDR5703796.1 cupin domain-containing protein [Armatimonadota bacterium]MDR7435323.1 cupin domain-containing protein [Armatimonadota bacterium]
MASVKKINLREVEFQRAPSRRIAELISSKTVGSRYISLRVVEIAGKREEEQREPHVHLHAEEIIYVQSGFGELHADDGVTPLEEGDAVLIPPGIRHMVRNRRETPMRLICVFSQPDPDAGRVGT